MTYHAQKLGDIVLDENGIDRQIGVYDVTLADGVILGRDRVGVSFAHPIKLPCFIIITSITFR